MPKRNAPATPFSTSMGLPKKIISTLVSVGLIFGPMPVSLAQVVAAPGGPTVTHPGNSHNVPVINIMRPNAAGLSHNYYQQFNVGQQGLILNNAYINSYTQLGGWVQGNPNFGGGVPARLILNEVVGGNATLIQGYLEVAGQRADVIIANPSGIAVSGGGFINAAGVTLTTGVPQISASGHLESYRVGGAGKITIDGGLDTQGADYTRIISRAVEVNSGIWAKDLTIAAGTGNFNPQGNPIQLTVEDAQGQPLYAIDVAALGGMYAGKIRLLGTEAGVGVRNAGHIGASAGQVAITADGELINTGTVNAQQAITLQSTSLDNQGTLYAQGNLQAKLNENLLNTGVVASAGDINISAKQINNQADALMAAGMGSDGTFNNQGSLNLNATQNISNDGSLLGGANLQLQSANLTNKGEISAAQNTTIQANQVDNQSTGEIQGGNTQVKATNLTNRGVIDGSNTVLDAQTLTNIGTGRIYGNQISINAQQLSNKAETVDGDTKAATIAARNQLDIGAQQIHNEEGALLYSAGNLRIGGEIDNNQQLQGKATLVQNDGATIEATEHLQIDAQQLNNTNSNYSQGVEVKQLPAGYFVVQVGAKEYPASEIKVGGIYNGTVVELGTFDKAEDFVAALGGLGDAGGIILPDGTFTMIFGTFVVNKVEEVTPKTLTSNPGQILAGGNMQLNTDVLNDKSQIMAGAGLHIDGNLQTVDAKGDYYIERTGGRLLKSIGGGSWTPLGESSDRQAQQSIALIVATPEGNTSFAGSGTQLGGQQTLPPNLTLPGGSLHTVNPGSNNRYLIETDPRLTSYGNWLTSDYMLGQLGLDPSLTMKRLGDGYYEQQLIRQQVGKLTGYRYLAGYQSDEEQYKALMNAGAEFAKEYELTLGVALSAEQMASLTSDIIWLVAHDVTLADGTVETVLAPQLYTRSGTNAFNTQGSLISANQLSIGNNTRTGEKPRVSNQALLAAREGLFIDASHLKNESTGQIHANEVLLQSQTDIENIGGVISGDKSITLIAERDIHIGAQTTDLNSTHTQGRALSNVGTVYLTGNRAEGTEVGNIHLQAGQDVKLTAGMIINADQESSTNIVAQRDIRIGTQQTDTQFVGIADARNWMMGSATEAHGSQIVTAGDIQLQAGNTLHITGSTVQSQQGALTAQAKQIEIDAAQNTHNYAQSGYKKSGGMLRKKSHERLEAGNEQTLSGSHLSANSIHLQAQDDINITASTVIGTEAVNLVSTEGNVQVKAGQEYANQTTYDKKKQSGLLSGGGGGLKGVTIGSKKTTNLDLNQSQTALGSVIGSLEGDLNISAQKGQYTQTGSELLALQQDINIVASDVQIKEARETQNSLSHYKHQEKGLSIGFYSPLGNRLTSAKGQISDLGKDSGSRWKAISALSSPTDSKAFTDAIDNDTTPQLYNSGLAVGGMNVGFNNKKEEKVQIQQSNTAKGSSLNAGGNIQIAATGQTDAQGNLQGGNLTIQGSDLNAGKDLTLVAKNQLNIIAAKNEQTQLNSSQRKASHLGMALEVSPLEGGMETGITGGRSRASDNSISKEQSWRYSTLNAGDNINLVSGADTDILGAHLNAGTINAQTGGNLTIASPQNQTDYLDFNTSSTSKLAIGTQAMAGSKKEKHAQQGYGQSINASTLSADEINLNAQKDINIVAGNVVATNDLNLSSETGSISIAAGKTNQLHGQLDQIKRTGPLDSEGGISATTGSEKQTQRSQSSGDLAIGSTVGSLKGNVNIQAKEGSYTQTGSDLLALDGDVNIIAQEITIKEAQEHERLQQILSYHRTGVTAGISSPIISMLQHLDRMNDTADRTSDDRMKALAVGAAALNIHNTLGNPTNIQDGIDALQTQSASVKLSVSIGSSSSKSQSISASQTASGSSIHAGKDINLIATGKTNEAGDKQGGNITLQGSEVSAAQNATLIANDKINILAAKNTQTHYSKEKSSSGSIGVGVAIGQQTGFGIDIGASGSKATDLELSHSWSGSKVSSGQTTTLISGSDTNIIGSQVKGNKVIADIGGDLNIESLQDVSYGHSDSRSTGGSISIGFGTYTSIGSIGGSASQDKSKADGYYASVNEYAGIFAGDEGFDVTVKGNTDLKGALIASTQEAIDNNKNSLTTGTLTTDHILNINTYESEGSSMSGGFSFDKDKNNNWNAIPKVSPTIPVKGDEESKEMSWTLSGISGGEITITDEEGQQQKTGRTAQETIDSINTDVTIHTPVNSLTKDWDTKELVDEMNANLEITKAWRQETTTFVNQQVAKADKERKEAEKKLEDHKEGKIQLTPEEFQKYTDQAKQQTIWDAGGIGRLVITAINGAISGNVSGSSSEILQGALVNTLQGLGAQGIKDLVDKQLGGDDSARAALHAILACGGAAAQGSDCGSAALGAGGAVVIGSLMKDYVIDPETGEKRDLTGQEKIDRINLIDTIITGVVEATGGDAQMGQLAAQIELENNQLAGGSFLEGMDINMGAMNDLAHKEYELERLCRSGCTDAQVKSYRQKLGLPPVYSTEVGLFDLLGLAREGVVEFTIAGDARSMAYSESWQELALAGLFLIIPGSSNNFTLIRKVSDTPLLPAGKPGTVVKNALSDKELKQATDYANFRGGEFVGATDKKFAGIDGWLDGVPVQLKVVEGSSVHSIRKNIVEGSRDLLKAKNPADRVGDLVIDARQTGVSMKEMIEHFKPGTPVSNIVTEGNVKNIYIQTNEGWLNVTSGMITKGKGGK